MEKWELVEGAHGRLVEASAEYSAARFEYEMALVEWEATQQEAQAD